MPSDPNLKEYYVLLMAATCLGPIEAQNEQDATMIARHKANDVIDPKQIIWVVKNISDLPFVIADPDIEEPPEATAPETPRILTL